MRLLTKCFVEVKRCCLGLFTHEYWLLILPGMFFLLLLWELSMLWLVVVGG
ncbi:hypothetical protein [Methylobacillus methanolivorans]